MPSQLHRLLVLCLVTTGLLALPQHATADTSYHKLKKNLRTAERIAGVILEKTGEGLAIVLVDVAVGIVEEEADDQPVATRKSATASPRSAPSSSETKASSTPPAKTTRPAKPEK